MKQIVNNAKNDIVEAINKKQDILQEEIWTSIVISYLDEKDETTITLNNDKYTYIAIERIADKLRQYKFDVKITVNAKINVDISWNMTPDMIEKINQKMHVYGYLELYFNIWTDVFMKEIQVQKKLGNSKYVSRKWDINEITKFKLIKYFEQHGIKLTIKRCFNPFGKCRYNLIFTW